MCECTVITVFHIPSEDQSCMGYHTKSCIFHGFYINPTWPPFYSFTDSISVCGITTLIPGMVGGLVHYLHRRSEQSPPGPKISNGLVVRVTWANAERTLVGCRSHDI